MRRFRNSGGYAGPVGSDPGSTRDVVAGVVAQGSALHGLGASGIGVRTRAVAPWFRVGFFHHGEPRRSTEERVHTEDSGNLWSDNPTHDAVRQCAHVETDQETDELGLMDRKEL